MSTAKVILVTGTSSGFGALTVRQLAKAGHCVYASMLDLHTTNAPVAKSYAEFASQNSVDLRTVELDVTRDDSVAEAIQHIIKESGRIDVLVHNAGHMCYGLLETYSAKQLLEYYDINAVGAHRVNCAALPQMRKARSGKLIWVGSSSTTGGTSPLFGPYFAAKAAMDSLAVTYAGELTKWGIESTLVIPGVFPSGTDHFKHAGKGSNEQVESEYLQGPYSGFPERVLKSLEHGDAPGNVEDVAKAIVKVVAAPIGQAPFRIHIDPWNDGSQAVNAVKDLARREVFERIGLSDLLKVKQ